MSKALVKIGLAALAALAIALGGYFGVKRIDGYFKEKTSAAINVYLLGLARDKKLVLVSSQDDYEINKTYSKKVLMLDFDATVRVRVLADLHYYLDLSDMDNLSVRYDPLRRVYAIGIARPRALYPSIHTDTIKVDVLDASFGSSLVLRIKKKVEAMKADISDEVDKQGQVLQRSQRIEAEFLASFDELVRSFCARNLPRIKFEAEYI